MRWMKTSVTRKSGRRGPNEVDEDLCEGEMGKERFSWRG